MDEEESILNEFLIECAEGIDRLDQEFVEIEKSPDDTALLGSIFRTIHTIKGTCGFLGLPKLENVAHGTENILSLMRDKKMDVTSDGITILLEAVDAIKEILSAIEEERKEPEKDYTPMRRRLDAFLKSGGRLDTGEPQKKAAGKADEEKTDAEAKPDSASEKDGAADPAPAGGLAALSEAELLAQIQEEMAEAEALEAAQKAEKAAKLAEKNKAAPKANPKPSETLKPPEAPKPPAPVAQKPSGGNTATTKKKKRSLAESSIRVDVDILDKLINMVGELVLARNQLLQQVRERDGSSGSDAANGTVQQLNLITTELQDTVMKTRMQPIKNVWDKFPRVVRDLAKSNGKDIELVMKGAETELDKTLLEAIKDPLTHIVRNSVDHGIELPEIRAERGKSAKGTLCLEAYHEGGQIIIEISDDGAGIDVNRVKSKAIEKGLISADLASRLTEKDALNLIFRAGLSTAKKVTNVSGRGVGMDVVRTNIEKIGGTIDLSSRLGEGTDMRIKIPLTLAIIPALMITSGKEPFAIPQASLLELVRVDEENSHQIEVIHGANFYRLRGVLLPLLSLNGVLNLEGPTRNSKDLHATGTNIVVLKAGEHSFGLVVDEVNDSEEIVVKPLNRQLKGLSYLAGATIMGDGRVALILDVVGIAQTGSMMNNRHDQKEIVMEDGSLEDSGTNKEAMILFSVSGEDHYAIPLSQIARLEEFDAQKIEQSAGQDVIQYRGDLLPLVRLGDTIGVMTSEENQEKVPAIVFSRHGKSVALVVGKILDIVEAEMILHQTPSEKIGVKGSLVISGATTDLLDADQLIECAVPGWMEDPVSA